jgi:hypothetical protein
MADLIKVGVELSPELYKQVKQRAIDLDLRLKDCVSQAFAQWLEKGGIRPANGLSTSHLKPDHMVLVEALLSILEDRAKIDPETRIIGENIKSLLQIYARRLKRTGE